MERPQISFSNLEQRLYSVGSFIKERPLEAVGSAMLFTGLPMFLTRTITYISNVAEPIYTVSEIGKYLGIAGCVLLAIGIHRSVKRKERELREMEQKYHEQDTLLSNT